VAESGLPGPMARLGRARPVAVGLALLGAIAIAAGGTGEVATVRLTEAVNANWRGAYDILVRPANSKLDLEATGGLVEPNFLGFAGKGGISFAQLDQIKAIPDVALAAPVSVVGLLSYTISAPVLCISPLPERPTLFQVEMTLLTSDGLRDIPLLERGGKLLVGPAAGFDRWASGLSPGRSGSPNEGDFSLGYVPPIKSPLVAVDPEAERALLGPSARFLERFEELATPIPTTRTFDLSLVPKDFLVARGDLENAATRTERPVVPLAVSETLYAPLALRLHLDRIGAPLPSWDVIPKDVDTRQKFAAAEEAAGAGPTPIGERTVDVSSALRPFTPPPLTIVAPGFEPAPGDCLGTYDITVPTLNAVSLMLRPDYAARSPRPGSLSPTFTIASKGLANPDAAPVQPPVEAGTMEIGLEPAYRTLRSVPLALTQDFRSTGPYDQPFYFAPITTFDLGRLDRPSNPLNYVPLGAYNPPATELVAGPDGRALPEPVPMRPTLNPAGLIAVPPLAITNLEAARLLRGDAPIDAIRVRVRGLTDFGAEARRRVERVASRIAELGLDVDIVAGSSPQPVEIYVPAYRVDRQPPGDLGFVRQQWTTLGAAERVERGLGETNLVLLLLALATAAVFAVGVQLSQLAARTRDTAILLALGWSRRRILGWYGSEALAAAGLIVLAGLVSWLVGPRSLWGLLATAGLAALLPTAALVGTAFVLRRVTGTPARGDLWQGAPTGRIGRVAGIPSYALRSLVARPLRSLTTAAALSLAAAALGLGVVLVAETGSRVGPTLLASALTDTLRPHQLALLALTGLTGIWLTLVLLAVDLTDRRREFLVLGAAGWSRRALRLLTLGERVALGVPAAIGSALLAAALAEPVTGTSGELPAALAALAAGSVALWGALGPLPGAGAG